MQRFTLKEQAEQFLATRDLRISPNEHAKVEIAHSFLADVWAIALYSPTGQFLGYY